MVVDHQTPQTIQYHFASQMDQNQGQQLIMQHQPQQQIKQTIYPQQASQVTLKLWKPTEILLKHSIF